MICLLLHCTRLIWCSFCSAFFGLVFNFKTCCPGRPRRPSVDLLRLNETSIILGFLAFGSFFIFTLFSPQTAWPLQKAHGYSRGNEGWRVDSVDLADTPDDLCRRETRKRTAAWNIYHQLTEEHLWIHWQPSACRPKKIFQGLNFLWPACLGELNHKGSLILFEYAIRG